jgi:hypothetical protein
MSTIQDIDREAARRVARVLGEDADAEAPGSDGGSGDAVPSPSSQHAATMDEARTKAKHTSRVVGRAWPYVPRILALAAVVAAISGLLQIAGISKHGRNRTGSLGHSGPVDPDDPQGVTEMKNTIQRQMMNAAVTASIGAATNAQQAVQWRVEDGGNGHWYALDLSSRDWLVAKSLAESLGGHLATPTSQAENVFLVQLTEGHPGDYWLGGYRSDAACNPPCMQWVTGEAWSYSNWGSGGPPVDSWGCWSANPNGCGWHGSGTGLALEFVRRDGFNGVWNDESPALYYNGNIVGAPSIFEWSADCNNDGIVDYGQILSGQLPDADTNGVPDTCECPCDVFPDNAVNGIDLGVLLGQWGEVTQYTVTDFNRDGAVDGIDLGQLLAVWGPCPS